MRQYTFLDDKNSKTLEVLCYVGFLFFVLGFSLFGVSRFSGIFYTASIVVFIPCIPMLTFGKLQFSWPMRIYIAAYISILLLYLDHVIFFGSDVDNLNNISRVGLGLLNGGFFLMLFRHRREANLVFVVLLALAHASVASTVAIWQGVNFGSMSLSAIRVGGITNPIPFSEMLLASLGIVAIYWSGRLDGGATLRKKLAPVLCLAVGLFALSLTGTRGTLIAIVLLVVLMSANVQKRSGWAAAILLLPPIALGILSVGIIAHSTPILEYVRNVPEVGPHTTQLSESLGLRLQMWLSVLELSKQGGVFGFGLSAYPSVLAQLDVPADFVLYSFNQVHNQYLDFLLDTGFIGLILFAAMLAAALFGGASMCLTPPYRDRGLILVWVSGCYAIFGLSESFFAHAVTSLQFGVYLGLLMWTIPTQQEKSTRT